MLWFDFNGSEKEKNSPAVKLLSLFLLKGISFVKENLTLKLTY